MMLIRIAITLAINAIALWVSKALFSGVSIHGWKAYLIAAIVLAIANAVIKPVLKVVTFPLVILTVGLFLLVINIAMIALAVWITPNFSIHGFWTYVGVVLVFWLVNWVAHEAHDRLD
jgi:putative membrane protein